MKRFGKYCFGWLDLCRKNNNLKIPDSVLFLFCDQSSTGKLAFFSGDFLRLRTAWDFLWVWLKALGIFLDFDF